MVIVTQWGVYLQNNPCFWAEYNTGKTTHSLKKRWVRKSINMILSIAPIQRPERNVIWKNLRVLWQLILEDEMKGMCRTGSDLGPTGAWREAEQPNGAFEHSDKVTGPSAQLSSAHLRTLSLWCVPPALILRTDLKGRLLNLHFKKLKSKV